MAENPAKGEVPVGSVPEGTSEIILPDFVPDHHKPCSPISSEYDRGKEGEVPIAIVGYSLRFPQKATSSEAFWRMLVEGRSARTEVPGDRFNVDAFYHPNSTRHDSMNLREAHFLDGDIAAFDAPFFSINPTEAASMDPQQRGLLETAYRAFENAGISLEEAAGSKTSVHIGCFTHDWKDMIRRDPLVDISYAATGTEFSILANRLSWFYDLTGPSVSLDTACSSSLMALHLACQSLKYGEADMGLVGGSNLLLDPLEMIDMANMGMLSPDGISHSFDDRANGYARGEGFAVVILKRLDDGLNHGDTIRGIIRATGSNQDGRTPGISQPSGAAQERLIRDTYRLAGLDLTLTRYFEAHGTGTQVGDPTEAKAIAKTFKSYRPPGNPLYVGSVKTNIGHTEGCSGLASLIKTVLILEKGLIPPNIWFNKINPRIRENEWNIKIPVEVTPWPANGPRRASVNSFGFGGSNVHVVLDDVFNYLDIHGPHVARCLSSSATDSNSSETLLVWSTADEDGLRRSVRLYASHLSRLQNLHEPQEYLKDLAYTLSARRSSLRYRACVVASSFQSLLQILEKSMPEAVRSKHACSTGFVFTGQGAQWHAMGRELLQIPLYRDSLRSSQKILGYLGCTWSVFDELAKDEDTTNIHDPAFSQPLCTIVQIALVDILSSFNIFPSAVVGHSSGEIAAAHSVGALSRESALKVAFYRGCVSARLASTCSKPGAMVAVNLSEAEVQPFLERTNTLSTCGEVSVACVNSPWSVTLSGDVHKIDILMSLLKQQKVVSTKLKVDVAYHSKAMDQVAIEYQTMIGDISTGDIFSNDVVMISSVTGAMVSFDEVCQPGYWVKNLTSQVRFLEAFSSLCLQSTRSLAHKVGTNGKGIAVTDVLEVGPHSALKKPINDILRSLEHGESVVYNCLLKRNVSALSSLFEAVGHLYCLGHPVNVTALNNRGQHASRTVLIDLPEYPFNRSQSYWAEGRLSKNFRFRKHPPHELLGTADVNWNPREPRWRNMIRATENPWILDHKIHGVELYPAAGMIVMAIEAARQVAERSEYISGYRLRDVSFPKALISVPRAEDFETNLSFRALETSENKASGSSEFRIYTRTNGEWTENCRGIITLEYEHEENEVDAGNEARLELQRFEQVYADAIKSCSIPVEHNMFYEALENQGLSYGETFQTLDEVRSSDCEAVGRVKLRKWATSVDEKEYQDHVVHPTALDGTMQLCYVPAYRDGQSKVPTMVPERIDEVWISARGLSQTSSDSVKAYANRSRHDLFEARCTVMALDSITSEPRVLLRDLRLSAVDSVSTTSPSNSTARKRLCYSMRWQPDVDLIGHQELRQICGDSVAADFARDKFIEDIEFICYVFIFNTLERVDQGSIIEIKPQFDRYVKWMKRQRFRYAQGELIHWQPNWPNLRRDESYVQTLISSVEAFSSEARLYMEIGKNLAGILEGRIDALNLLFSGNLAAEYYVNIIKSLKRIEPYVDALAHKYPGLKVLEIGAGTGSATTFFLETLTRTEGGHGTSRCARYTFTDISPHFFEKAKERYGNHAERMVYAPLDIERDPLQQGFLEHDNDLIVAVNVLHATSDLSATLRNVRKLLRPGGQLVLCELHNDVVSRVSLAFGSISGWWKGTEEARQWGPTISDTDWHSALCANGFSGADVVCWDYADLRNRMSLIIISTALAPPISPLKMPGVTIITDGKSTVQRIIGDQIQIDLAARCNVPSEVLSISNLPAEAIETQFCIFLPEVDTCYLRNMNEEQYIQLQLLFRSAKAVFWITRGGGELAARPELDMIVGLSRVYHSESTTAKIITLSLPNAASPETVVKHTNQILLDRLRNRPASPETEYEVRNGKLCINRVVESNDLNDYVYSKLEPQTRSKRAFGLQALALSIGSKGFLDKMEYVEDTEFERPLEPDEVEVKVKAVGVNFKDVLVALGRLNQGVLGLECAGIITRAGQEATQVPGDRVFLLASDAYRTYVRSKTSLVFMMPDTLSFREAASFPVAFLTAYHALCRTARLSPGETVLIHSAAGGTGQAAVQMASFLKAEIFATVGSNEKKKLIMDFYGIPGDHIFSSRGLSFVKGIMRMTEGRGVDVVLNSLADEGLQGSWDCLAAFGRFVEIGKKDILARHKLPMLPFNENRTFAAVDLSHMLSERPDLIQQNMEAVWTMIRDKHVTAPQPLHVYSSSRIEDAFRYLQSGKNTGKTVVELNDDDVVQVVTRTRSTYDFRPDRTYLIAGGLGGLGRRIARWMIEKGAKHLLLLSRSGASTEAAREFVNEFQDVSIAAPRCDVSDGHALARTLDQYIKRMPPIQGCIQASMVLEDADFQTMPFEAFTKALGPKVAGSWNLHTLLPGAMDFFILLSSVSGVAGYLGQANYAAGNTYQDALARHRVANGQKAVAVDLGVVDDVGYVAERPGMRDALTGHGVLSLGDAELLALLDRYCDPDLAVLSGSTCQVVTGLDVPASMAARGQDDAYWMRKSLFKHLRQIRGTDVPPAANSTTDDPKTKTKPPTSALLAAAASRAEAALVVSTALTEKLSGALSMPMENIDATRPPHVCGVDSLVALELRNWFAREVGAEVSVFEILGGETIVELGSKAAGRIMPLALRSEDRPKMEDIMIQSR